MYDKPLLQYPLQILLDAGIRHIAVITGPEHMEQITKFLGSGSRFGCEFAYRVQEKPKGIAEALGLARELVGSDHCCVLLGDNVFFSNLSPIIKKFTGGGHLFVKNVSDPERFGVVTMEGDRVKKIEEKPKNPASDMVATGCYIYDSRCFDVIASLTPSARNELEISDVSEWYARRNELTATVLDDEWIDAGTFESLFRASELVRMRTINGA